MPVPQVVIVGRPNVGKSSLLNWLAGRRISIVDDHAGVTRDRIVYLMEAGGRFFELVDTGGIGIEDCDNLTKEIEAQIETGLETADVVLFVCDTRTGLVPLDEEVARRLRYIDKPIILVANKADAESLDSQADEFYKLGRGKIIKVSTQQNRHQEELLRMILERLPPQTSEEEEIEEPMMKMAIVGRRNTGKSTFVNTLARAERCIVSEVPGTTRDSVDVRFELDGKTFMAIDTPGLKRSKSVKTDIDFYSTHRAQRSIRRADVVLLFFDCSQRLSKVDKQLCKYIADNYRPCIFVVNKWDLLYGQMPTEKWVDYLRDTFSTMWHVPIAFITGQTGKNVKALLNHAQMLFKQSLQRVSTAKLNQMLRDALDSHPPPLQGLLRPKIYFATQVSTQPPTIVLMCNEPSAFPPSYRRYLLGYLRDQLDFGEVPIKLYLQRREQRLRGREAPEEDLASGRPQKSRQNVVPEDDTDVGAVFDEGNDEDHEVLGESDYEVVDLDSSDVNLTEE
ncbi:GTPase Der [Anatilimnocola aggregata]|uniref:GTPase Der n=1 Tax=Anatilimnocola aggregata TaxID=2528021 RepID=A0A517YI29_9BACT|nr:ribosome biogenesis GTPase Der [Anatilimnocola aggregata]QDU29878.1 GTPase Der [Anatilimnocola aggregata]